MKRLTIRLCDGRAHFKPELYGRISCVVCDRLAAIEDILGDEYDLDRLRELVEADRDGRCVVLPCKRDDVLWTFQTYPSERVYSFHVTDVSVLNGRAMLNTDIMGVVDARDVGRAVFLTRAEAEDALKAREAET